MWQTICDIRGSHSGIAQAINPSGIQRCVFGRVLSDVSNYRTASIFRVKELRLLTQRDSCKSHNTVILTEKFKNWRPANVFVLFTAGVFFAGGRGVFAFVQTFDLIT